MELTHPLVIRGLQEGELWRGGGVWTGSCPLKAGVTFARWPFC